MTVKRSDRIAKHTMLTIPDVIELGCILVHISDRYPLLYRTELDFFPLVEAYLHGSIPSISKEHDVKNGRIDFRIGGTNPTLLEIAVQARRLVDKDDENIKIAGHIQQNALQYSQNKAELTKLRGQNAAKTRFLLLVDLIGKCDVSMLLDGYRQKSSKSSNRKHKVNVIYVSRNKHDKVSI